VDESYQVIDQCILNSFGKMRLLKLFKLFVLNNISKAAKIFPDEFQSKLKKTEKRNSKAHYAGINKGMVDFYTTSVNQLEDYTNRDLSNWLK